MPGAQREATVLTDGLLDLPPESARERIAEWVSEQSLPGYRTNQILARLWKTPVRSWAEATELPTGLRDQLDANFPIPRLRLDVRQQSKDGTRKYLWRLDDGEAIESVLIPTGARRTLCISSQAGCALGCTFCATGRMGYRRNLSAFEIAGQIREIVLEDAQEKPTNIVFMGMGEPLLNWPAVNTALSILNSSSGLGIGARHITVSTVGILPGLAEFAKRPEQFRLAISLHAPTSAQRIGIMPIEKKYDLESVLRAAEVFRKRVTFEYVMIGGVNDSDADADRLARMARRLGALVNILPLHPGGAPDLTPTGSKRIKAFADRLRHGGVEATVRRSRGLDIDAACGQLRVEVEKKRRRSDTSPHPGVPAPQLLRFPASPPLSSGPEAGGNGVDGQQQG
jgi:23S rRNA (adenine2503-C2)-methyltransferase